MNVATTRAKRFVFLIGDSDKSQYISDNSDLRNA